MQPQKQNVLVPAKRKQMRPQRHLARKIKTNLRRSRQRTRKLPFAYRAYRKPNAPRSPSQNLLPRNPKPLRKDRAQALVALNDIPKRSFQRPHLQLATNPDRERDHLAPATAFQPLQKPQPTLAIRHSHLARTLNRSQRRTRGIRIPTAQPAHRHSSLQNHTTKPPAVHPTDRPRSCNRPRHTREPHQRGLHLPRLNAEAANLNLMVRSPPNLQNPTPPAARQVPAAVHP